MDNNLGNSDSFTGLNWIISDAPKGFFFALASHKMQESIACSYTTNNIAKLNYSDIRQYSDLRLYDEQNTEHYRFRVLSQFADDHKEKKIFFILNFQIPFPAEDDIHNLNFSRDWIADKNKVWIFFMTAELEKQLYHSAPDFHSYCNLKLQFEDMGTKATKQELLKLSENITTLHQTNEIRERLARYKEMEEEYLSYFETTPDGTVQLLRKELPDSQLLAIANTLGNIAELYRKTGDYKNTIQILERVLLIRGKILGLRHPDIASSFNNIGEVYDDAGDYNKALEYHNKALNIRENTLGLQHPDTAESYHNVGVVYDDTGDYNKALEYYNKSLKIRIEILGLLHPDTASSYYYIGKVYNGIGDYNKALTYLNKALDILEKVLDLQHPNTATFYDNIGTVYYNMDVYNQALTFYRKSLEIREKVLGLQHPDTACSYYKIGFVYDNMGNYHQALAYYNKALEIREKVFGKEHPNTKTVLGNIKLLQKNVKYSK